MAFYVGTINYFPGLVPAVSTATAGSALTNDGTNAYWAYPGASITTLGGTLQYRSILTHGYVAGGYKDANPWRTVNKTWHSTDITICCGDQIDQAANYNGGTFSDYNGYVHACSGAHATASAHTSSYNLHTGNARTVGTSNWGTQPSVAFGFTGKDPNSTAGFPYGQGGSLDTGITDGSGASGTGTWEMSVGRTYFGGLTDQLNQIGYIAGGTESQVTDRFHMPTEIMYQTTSTGVSASHTAAGGGASIGWWSFGGTAKQFNFSTLAYSAWSASPAPAPDGVCKILTTKLGYHYVGTGTNNTTGWGRFSDSTGAMQSTAVSKPSSFGEENFEMGQNWGYCLGQYNGQQNNYSTKHNYLTDAITVMGSSTQPKGHAGLSSAVCSSAAASITSSYM